MKKILLMLIIIAAMSSCSRTEVHPEYLTAQVYSVPIKYANYNEPTPMYWYIVELNGNFYVSQHSNPKPDLISLKWEKSSVFPSDVYKNGKRLPDQIIPYSTIAALVRSQ